VPADSLGERQPSVRHGPHQVNSPARAVVLISQFDVGRTGSGAKPAVNAVEKQLVVDAVARRGARWPRGFIRRQRRGNERRGRRHAVGRIRRVLFYLVPYRRCTIPAFGAQPPQTRRVLTVSWFRPVSRSERRPMAQRRSPPAILADHLTLTVFQHELSFYSYYPLPRRA
jgi:hypothetical protein